MLFQLSLAQSPNMHALTTVLTAKQTLRAVKQLQTRSSLVTYVSVWRRDLRSPNSNFLRPGRLTSSFGAKWSKRDGFQLCFQSREPNLRKLLKAMKVWSYNLLSMYELKAMKVWSYDLLSMYELKAMKVWSYDLLSMHELKAMKVWSYDLLSMYELLNDTIQPLYHLSFRNKWCFL